MGDIVTPNAVGPEKVVGVSIVQQINFIRDNINVWATEHNGIAIAENETNKDLLIGFQNARGPKIIVSFTGEQMATSSDIADLVGWARRSFQVLIERPKLMSGVRSNSFSDTDGVVRSFSDLLEQCRDICRCIIWPVGLCQNPTEYNGMNKINRDDAMDSFTIDIAVITNIGRIQTEPNPLGGGQEVELEEPLIPLPNQPPF